MTPYEALYGKKPDLANLRAFGERVWVHDPTNSKLDAQARVGRWLGFDEISSGHRIYWPEERKVSVERSVQFEDVLEGELAGGSGKRAPPARTVEAEMEFCEVEANSDEKEDEPPAEAPPAFIEPIPEDTPEPEPLPAPTPAAEDGPRRSARARTDLRIVHNIKSGLGGGYAFVVETGAAEGIERSRWQKQTAARLARVGQGNEGGDCNAGAYRHVH